MIMNRVTPRIGIEKVLLDSAMHPFLKTCSTPLARACDSVLKFGKLNRHLAYFKDKSLLEIFKMNKRHFEYDYEDKDNLVTKIPSRGAVVILANHPTGLAETLILTELIYQKRKDVKVLSNGLLGDIKEISSLLISIDLRHKDSQHESFLNCENHLNDSGALLIFPAGEISSRHNQYSYPRDRRWSQRIIALATKAKAKLIHVHISGMNSKLFYAVSRLNFNCRLALASIETYNKKKSPFGIHSSEPIAMRDDPLVGPKQVANGLRYLNYALPHRSFFSELHNITYTSEADDTCFITPEYVYMNACSEIANLSDNSMLFQRGSYALYDVDIDAAPGIINFIQFEREKAFRAVGMGSGENKDADNFDSIARHLVIWDNDASKLVGAYRYSIITRPSDASYVSSLFPYNKIEWLKEGDSLELSRAFVAPEYQKNSNALKYLLFGISKVLKNNEQVRFMVGCSSITNTFFPQKILDLLAIYLQHNAARNDYMMRHFTARNPYDIQYDIPREIKESVQHCITLKQLENVFFQLSGVKYALPILFKLYESVGVKFLSAGVDSSFSSIGVLSIWDLKFNLTEKGKMFCLPEDWPYFKARFHTSF